MKKRESDPSLKNEPHLRKDVFSNDPSEERADITLDKSQKRDFSEMAMVDRTVWDEPALSSELAGKRPSDSLVYSEWLTKRRNEIGPAKSMMITIGIAALAGPFAIAGAFIGYEGTILSFLAVVVIGPLLEEMLKVALALYVVEKLPFYFRSSVQIVLCVLAGAFVFSAIENIIYHNVYIREPSEALIHWRWTVCVALHMSCSCIASLGLIAIWRETWKTLKRPKITRIYPYLLTAAVVHGAYNAFVVVLDFTGFHF